ncbi:MAG: AraC family transcriptional regulator [Chlorobi bacterium]|nr:MAG: helix-turn-helix transcriptional regulator [Rhodocyclaceae bacterium]MBL1162153.1 AraC family transcriptional regulator [Chlorobiota bacterium]MBZ0194919.1 AraC family transcriptional regulator [Candidatus Kapabacteria bacterium]QOJ25535.1 MAG: helix-turn-helix transcriptional regulator [Ignavibacteria bacterium]MBV6462851.1 HTH-type transcriptional activator RhaR [Chlorobiota bacterium]
MIFLKDFEAFNNYVGLPKPLDNNIDIGYYDGQNTLLQSEPVMIDFYRISIKSNYIDLNNPDNPKPVIGVFFTSPDKPLSWKIEQNFNGMYVQISKKLIDENRFLFQNYLGYGEHEALQLTDNEEKEIRTVFDLLFKHYHTKQNSYNVLLSYVHVLVSLVETFYHRQFSTDIKKYNRIVSEFQQLLNDYYNTEATQLPTVQFFADQLRLSSNYLGDIIKYFTNKSAIETIHDFVINRAKKLLTESNLNNAEIAYELGFEYPNYFAKLFKKHTQLTPKEYRNKFQSKQIGVANN